MKKILEYNIQQDKNAQTYIETICARVPRNKRAEIKLELESHFADLVEMELENGRSQQEASAYAIANFGDAKHLQSEIYKANRPLYWQLAFVIPALFACLLVLAMVGVVELYRYDSDREITRKNEKLEEKLAELKSLDKTNQEAGFLKNITTGRDFGPVINSRLPWTGYISAHNEEIHSNRKKTNSIRIPDQVVEKIEKILSNKNWIQSIHQIDMSKVDIEWMNSLKDYDYWDVTQTEEEEISTMSPIARRFPFYNNIQHYAVLALVTGFKQKSLARGIRNAEHYLRLVNTNEDVLSTIQVVGKHPYIKDAFEYGKKNGLLPKDFKLLIDAKTVESFERALWHRLRYFDFNTDPKKLTSMYTPANGGSTKAGLCHGIQEGIWRMARVHRYVDSTFPFEKSYAKQLSNIEKIIQSSKKHCRLRYARKMWEQKQKLSSFVQELDQYGKRIPIRYTLFSRFLHATANLPFLRQTVARTVMTGRKEFSAVLKDYLVYGNY